MSALDKLAEIVTSRCLARYAANEETVLRWESFPLAMLEEQFHVNRLPAEHDSLLRSALDEWKAIENRAISIVTSQPLISDADADDDALGHKVVTTFEERFLEARTAFICGDLRELEKVQSKAMHLSGGWAIKNINMVYLLAVYLPQAVDASQKSEIAFHGRRAAGLSYLKLVDDVVSHNRLTPGLSNAIAGVDAAWHLSCTWSNRGEVNNPPPLGVSEYEVICKRMSGSLFDPLA